MFNCYEISTINVILSHLVSRDVLEVANRVNHIIIRSYHMVTCRV